MSLNGDTALIERLYAEGMNRRDPEAAANFYARDASNHGQHIGREGFARVFTSLALQAQTPDYATCSIIRQLRLEGLAWFKGLVHPHERTMPCM
jgi:hypothetical protein